MRKARVFTSQGIGQGQKSSAPQLTRFIEQMRVVSQAYAKLAFLLEDSASEVTRLERTSAASGMMQIGRETDPCDSGVSLPRSDDHSLYIANLMFSTHGLRA
jgi:hypothetical protein